MPDEIQVEKKEEAPSWVDRLAFRTGGYVASAIDQMTKVFFSKLKGDWKSTLINLDGQGNYTLKTSASTMSIVLQTPGGYLDGLTVQFNDFSYAYPNNQFLQYDVICLPAPGIPLKLSGTANNQYLLIESMIPNFRPSFTGEVGALSHSTKITSDGTGTGAIAGVLSINGAGDGINFNGIGSAASQWMYNGATNDRVRNNTQGTLLASATRTATTQASTQTNYNSRGVMVFLNCTSASGTGGLQVVIQSFDPVTGINPSGINATPSAITTTGEFRYLLYPGASSSNCAQTTPAPIPRTWSVAVQHVDGSNYTYSVGYSLIN